MRLAYELNTMDQLSILMLAMDSRYFHLEGDAEFMPTLEWISLLNRDIYYTMSLIESGRYRIKECHEILIRIDQLLTKTAYRFINTALKVDNYYLAMLFLSLLHEFLFLCEIEDLENVVPTQTLASLRSRIRVIYIE